MLAAAVGFWIQFCLSGLICSLLILSLEFSTRLCDSYKAITYILNRNSREDNIGDPWPPWQDVNIISPQRLFHWDQNYCLNLNLLFKDRLNLKRAQQLLRAEAINHTLGNMDWQLSDLMIKTVKATVKVIQLYISCHCQISTLGYMNVWHHGTFVFSFFNPRVGDVNHFKGVPH